jgi:hypothetical protein
LLLGTTFFSQTLLILEEFNFGLSPYSWQEGDLAIRTSASGPTADADIQCRLVAESLANIHARSKDAHARLIAPTFRTNSSSRRIRREGSNTALQYREKGIRIAENGEVTAARKFDQRLVRSLYLLDIRLDDRRGRQHVITTLYEEDR